MKWDPSGRKKRFVDGGPIYVLRKELGRGERMRLWWWILRHKGLPMSAPRASWAQMLLALGIKETKTLAIDTREIDADTIPASIDVAVQGVRLFDLGILAFSMAYTSVSIDIIAREFRAVGPFAVISTEEVETFCKVLRFEGDIYSIRRTIGRCSSEFIVAASSMLLAT